MKRAWSIRARTAFAFALTSMALAGAAIITVNLGSQHALSDKIVADFDHRPAVLKGRPALATDPAATPAPGAVIAVSATVATLQWQWSVLGIGTAGVLAGGTGWLLSRRMLAPIDRMTATATRISASTLHERIALDGPDDELRRLSVTIDGLLDRLEQAFESQRRFVAQASHELRTPLAVQRAAIQIGLHDDADAADVARAREDLLEQNRRTEHLVESLLVLAEAERGLDSRTTEFDLGDLVEEVVVELAEAARTAGVTLACRRDAGSRGPVVVGEPVLTRQLLRNLVDNAVEYNMDGGTVDVVVDSGAVSVENSGPSIDPAVAEGLTRPFCRGGAETRSERQTDGRGGGARRHSGLGLSIVAAVADAHGWSLEMRARPAGGLVVTLDTRGPAA